MVNVMKDDDERSQHSRLFQRSLCLSLSKSASHTSISTSTSLPRPPVSPMSTSTSCNSYSRSDASSATSSGVHCRREAMKKCIKSPASKANPRLQQEKCEQELYIDPLDNVMPEPPIPPEQESSFSTATEFASSPRSKNCRIQSRQSMAVGENQSISSSQNQSNSSTKTSATLQRQTKSLKSILRSNGFAPHNSSTESSDSVKCRPATLTCNSSCKHFCHVKFTPVPATTPRRSYVKHDSFLFHVSEKSEGHLPVKSHQQEHHEHNHHYRHHQNHFEGSHNDNASSHDKSGPFQSAHCPINIDEILKNTLEADAYVKVVDLPWTEQTAPYRRGLYTGVVNIDIQPHGFGLWRLSDSGCSEVLSGSWYIGSYINQVWKEILVRKLLSSEAQCNKRNDCNAKNEDRNRYFSRPSPSHHINRHGISVSPLPFSDDDKECVADSPRKKTYEQSGQYTLGDTLRSYEDTLHKESRRNSRAIRRLRQYDFAFVKRSNMTWSYAILADRRERKVHASVGKTEEMMIFVIARNGQTKSIFKRHWEKYILCPKDCKNSISDETDRIEKVIEEKNRLILKKNRIEDYDDSFIGIDTHRPSHDNVERPSADLNMFNEKCQKATSQVATSSLHSWGSEESGKCLYESPQPSASAAKLESNPISPEGRPQKISDSHLSNNAGMSRSEDYSFQSEESSVYWA